MTLPAWPSVRAGLLAGVLAVYGLAALPLPHAVKRASFDEPVAREELTAQAAWLGRVGVATTADGLADALYTFSAGWVTVYDHTLKPLAPLFRLTGTGQSWGLFTYPDTFPHQLVVEVRAGKSAPWQVWFQGLDPEHDWMRDVIAYRRVRGVYDGQTTKPGASWNNLTRWLARRAFEQDATLTTVRVSFRRFHTVRPGEPADPAVETLRHVRSWDRAQVDR